MLRNSQGLGDVHTPSLLEASGYPHSSILAAGGPLSLFLPGFQPLQERDPVGRWSGPGHRPLAPRMFWLPL